MARVAKPLLVRPLIAAAPRKRHDVVDLVAGHVPALLEARPAERLLVEHLRPIALACPTSLARILVRRVAYPRLAPFALSSLPEHGRLAWHGYLRRPNERPLDQLRVRVVVVTMPPDRLVLVVVVTLCKRCPMGTLLAS